MLERAHRNVGIALALGAAAVLGACGGSDANDQAADTTTVGMAAGSVDSSAAGAMGGGAMTEAEIFGFVSLVDNAEVEAAQLAKEKASNNDVKQYAQMLIEDHSKNAREAGDLAQRLNINPTEPTSDQMQQAHQQLMSKLNSTSGAEFDRAYIDGMIQGHSAALERLNAAMNATQNTDAKQFLNTTRDVVQKHLERAQQIQGQLSS